VEFVCRVGAPDGRVLEEVLVARDEGAVRGDLERRGFQVFEVRRRGLRLSLPRWRRRRRPVGLRDLLIFNQELAGLLRAGLPLLHSLELLQERQRNADLKTILRDVADRVRSGEELSQAFRAHGEHFPALYASSLTAGERSGELEPVLRRFIRYLRLVLDTRKKVISALVYPTLLVVLSAAMVAVMIVAVIPRFSVFYEAMEVELPLPTRIILGFSTWLQSNLVWLALGLAGGVFALRRWAATDPGRRSLDRLKLRLPLVGTVLHRFSLSEFCRSLATLLGGGMPLVPALGIGVDSVSNAFIRSRLQPVVGKVREGQALHRALEESGVVSDLAIDMVKVGEATGALDEMLGNVSDFMDDEVETRIQRLLSLVEPLMLVFMGVVVSLLLVAMYLPMFSVLGQMQ
jgi:type IV pilus assembly protein PilC